VRVCLAAISVALAGSGTVVLTTKMLFFKHPRPTLQVIASRQQAPMNVAQDAVPPTDQAQPPPIAVVGPGPTRLGLAQDSSPRSSRSNNIAEFRSAALSLIQGHYADAQVAYASLAARTPTDPAYVALSRLLARRLGPLCSSRASSEHQTSCPEIKP